MTGPVRQRFYSTVKFVPAAVKDNVLNVFNFSFFGDSLADNIGAVDFAAAGRAGGSRGRKRNTLGVINYLSKNVLMGTKHGQPDSLTAAGNFTTDAAFSLEHNYSPAAPTLAALPGLRRTDSFW